MFGGLSTFFLLFHILLGAVHRLMNNIIVKIHVLLNHFHCKQ